MVLCVEVNVGWTSTKPQHCIEEIPINEQYMNNKLRTTLNATESARVSASGILNKYWPCTSLRHHRLNW